MQGPCKTAETGTTNYANLRVLESFGELGADVVCRLGREGEDGFGTGRNFGHCR